MERDQNIMPKFNYLRPAVDAAKQMRTPFYFYDMELLRKTLETINQLTADRRFKVHYAIKANGNPQIISEIAKYGIGADLVSGGEINAAAKAGFAPANMNFSGVGKTDWEIRTGLEYGIGCFNVESVPELEVINEIAGEMEKTARVAIRVNPDIDAHTHHYVTTGTADNKFGINIDILDQVIEQTLNLPHLHLSGLHFHIGSQITDMQPYSMLCETVNRLIDEYEQRGIHFEIINVGGGLGIDYHHPDEHPLPELETYFNIFKENLHLRPNQELHFELGRAIVASCGSLISRVVYVKENRNKQFVILDAGMNDLIRPALYNAYHEVQNITSREQKTEKYDVVGPVCESSDVFVHDHVMPLTRRGDLVAIRSAGAYCESMASTYNMRPIPPSFYHFGL